MKKILAFAACLVLVAALALPAFAAYAYDPDTGEFSGGSGLDDITVTEEILEDGSFSVLLSKSGSSSSSPVSLVLPNSSVVVASSVVAASTDWEFYVGGIKYHSTDTFPIPLRLTQSAGKYGCTCQFYWGSNTSAKIVFQVVTNVPDVSNMTDGESLTITGFYGRYLPLSKKLNEGQYFTFSNVVGTPKIALVNSSNVDSTSVSYVTVTEGYVQIPSDTYDYVFVGDVLTSTDSVAPYSYTLTFHSPEPPPELDDDLFGIVGGLADTMFTAGTSLISWATTGSNFIVLIPLSLFVLVAVVLFIRKLIKGV